MTAEGEQDSTVVWWEDISIPVSWELARPLASLGPPRAAHQKSCSWPALRLLCACRVSSPGPTAPIEARSLRGSKWGLRVCTSNVLLAAGGGQSCHSKGLEPMPWHTAGA